MAKPEKAVEPVETTDKMIETAEEEKTEPMSEDSEIEPVMKKQKSKDFDSILLELDFMNENQIKRSKIILDLINQSETVTVESNDVLHVNKETLGIKASTFLYNLQQPTKKYSKILIALNISPHLVANTHAKQILENSSESEHEFYPSREKPGSSGSKSTPTKDYEETSDKTTDKKETNQKKGSFFSWSKTFGTALFKRTTFLWKHKTLTYSEQAPSRWNSVLFGDKTVFHKVPFNSIKISQALRFCKRH